MGAGQKSPVFVGRDTELALLGEASARVRDGSPAAVLVGGEAGVGKSRLVAEFTAALPEEALVLVGGCVELGESGLAFAPFTTVLRGLVRTIGANGVLALLPDGEARELGRLLPILGRSGGDGTADLARARLFEEFLTVLAGLAERQHVVLVIEDMHWADRSSRELLGFLIRNQQATSTLLTIITHRSDQLHRAHPLRRLLAELDRVAWAMRLELGRLTRHAVTSQLRGLLGHEPDAGLSEKIFRRSEGNPLFVEALATRADTPVPESIRDLLITPLERLSVRTRQIVKAAAASGVRVDHELLSAVTGLGDTAVSDALRPAVESNLILVEENAYAFRHALIREVLYKDLLPGERTRLHMCYAETLEKDPTLTSPGRATVEAAHHWYASKRHPAMALAASWRAAAEALTSLAYAEQLHMLLQVLELWDHVSDAAVQLGTTHAEVREAAVHAAISAGENTRAMELITFALEETSDAVRTGRLLGQRGELRHALGLPGDLADLRDAVRLIPPGHRARSSVLNTLANRLLTVPREQEGRAIARQAIAEAQANGDVRSEAMATINITYAPAATGLDETASALPVIGPVQRAHQLAFAAETGRPELWDRVADAWADLHQPYPQAWALLRAAEAATEGGDHACATSHLRRAAAHADFLSARPLRSRIDQLARLARISLTPVNEPSAGNQQQDGFGLTPRERQVLDLVADGRTNRQIAEEPYISVKTAGTHVSSILGKLGVTSRVQAAAAAHRHRLIRTDTES